VYQCFERRYFEPYVCANIPTTRKCVIHELFERSSNGACVERYRYNIQKASDSIDPSWDDLVPSLSPLNIKMLCVVRKQSHSVLFVEHRMSKTVVPGHQQVVNMLRFNRLLGLRTVEINHCFNFTGIRDE